MVPADDQAMVLPCASVMVIMVLLNDAFTCATPEAMFLRSRRRTRAASLPIHDPFAARRPGGHRCGCLTCLTTMRPPSSFRRSLWPVPCGSVRWYACAGREPAGPCDAATHGSIQGP